MYALYEYREAGIWKPYFHDGLWQCRFQSGRLEMPWRIMRGSELIDRGHGQASIIEA